MILWKFKPHETRPEGARYGAPIVSGLSLNDVPTILTGAIPAALMALVAHGLFELLALALIPAGLRRRP